MLLDGNCPDGDRRAIGRSAALLRSEQAGTDEARGGGRRPHSPEVYRLGLFLAVALRRRRQGFSGTGISAQLETLAGYLGAGIGSYGWRGTGTRLFIGWPTGPHQTFELSYTRLKRGGSTEPAFTYGVQF